MLARIFKRPSNIMVLDEPTNDLDAESLELLEELISDYPGTLLLVSHDRAFLNNLVTSTLVFDDNGSLKEYAGGYDDYIKQRNQAKPLETTADTTTPPPTANESATVLTPRIKKLTFKEKARADELFVEIEALESEQQQLNDTLSNPEFFKEAGDEITRVTVRLTTISVLLPEKLTEWEELESRR